MSLKYPPFLFEMHWAGYIKIFGEDAKFVFGDGVSMSTFNQ